MAVLFHPTSGRRVRPAARCLVGRAPHCHLLVDNTGVSREHAVLSFDGAWKVRDLASKNGTWVNGERVREFAGLHEGALLRFGSEGNEWQVSDAGPPCARAVSNTDRAVVMSAAGLLLPDPDTYEASISSEDGVWVLERDGEIRTVHDGEIVELGAEQWRLELTLGDHLTLPPTTWLGEAFTRLQFKSNLNEEHVELVVHSADHAHVLQHRSHLYLLLLLARARIKDQAHEQLPASEQGWIETRELADMLRTTSEQINVWIWRARQQLKTIDPELAQRVVERRPTLGQLRIGYDALTDERG